MSNKIQPEMYNNLLSNRDGRLTTAQWKDMVTEPLVRVLLVLMFASPLLLFMGPRALVFGWRGLIVALVAVFILFVVPMVFRARRYARAPLYHALLRTGSIPRPWWLFWRPHVLFADDGTPQRFNRMLVTPGRLKPNTEYMVYYLKETDQNVLLSLIAADHPDANRLRPSVSFFDRQARRQSQG